MTLKVTRRPCSDNFHKGRIGKDGKRWTPDAITIHVTEGTAASARSWFNTKTADVSSHYLVAKNGDRDQFVDEDDTALTNGVVDRPEAALVLARPGVNPNLWTISIEHEGRGNEDLTSDQLASSAELIADIVRRRPVIQLNRRHIIPHREIRKSKTCPGKIDVDRLIRAASGSGADASSVTIARPRIVYSNYLKDYVIVTRYASDRDWSFIPMKALAGTGTKAQTPLSQMPVDNP